MSITTQSNSSNPKEDNSVIDWQKKLLPWVLTMVTAMVITFIVLATLQLNDFKEQVQSSQVSDIERLLISPKDRLAKYPQISSNVEYIKLYCLAKMEESALNKRHNQAGFLLLSRMYIKYIGFFTGMILAMVGATFILSKFKEDTAKLDGTVAEKIKMSLVTSSPGTIFGVLGTILMLATILYNGSIHETDSPLYMNYLNLNNFKADTLTQNINDTSNIPGFDTSQTPGPAPK